MAERAGVSVPQTLSLEELTVPVHCYDVCRGRIKVHGQDTDR